MEMMKAKTLGTVVLCSAILFGTSLAWTGVRASPRRRANTDNDVAALKAQLAEQQKQIDALKSAIEEQKKLIDKACAARRRKAGQDTFALPRNKALGEVASTTPIIPSIAPAVATPVVSAGTTGWECPPTPAKLLPTPTSVPPYLRLGNVCITPIGFMDATFVWRDKNAGIGYRKQFRQHSVQQHGRRQNFRIPLQHPEQPPRVPRRRGLEGRRTSSATTSSTSWAPAAPATSRVTNGAVVPRIRLYWVDVRKNGWEFLAGQSWSMLTPNRRGISPLPGDLFYSQVFDVNYMAGLTWTRQPGFRVLYHFGNTVTVGLFG